jgi:hypothetical protein
VELAESRAAGAAAAARVDELMHQHAAERAAAATASQQLTHGAAAREQALRAEAHAELSESLRAQAQKLRAEMDARLSAAAAEHAEQLTRASLATITAADEVKAAHVEIINNLKQEHQKEVDQMVNAHATALAAAVAQQQAEWVCMEQQLRYGLLQSCQLYMCVQCS